MEGGWREFGVTTVLLSLGLGPLAANPPSRQGLGLVQLESDLTDLCDVKNKSKAEETPFCVELHVVFFCVHSS